MQQQRFVLHDLLLLMIKVYGYSIFSVLTDVSQVIKEQANFYKSLYSTNKNTSHRHELFFDIANPFLTSWQKMINKNVKVPSLKKSASKL